MKNRYKHKILALSGGVGGAKLVHGLVKLLNHDQLLIATNTGDDFMHLGLKVCPDLDTVMYTLAGMANKKTLWGIEGDTWNFMDALKTYSDKTWFNLGDRDLVTHVIRSEMLNQGQTLTEVTAYLTNKLGVKHPIVPMSDQAVETWVATAAGEIHFQEYFVKAQCRPTVTGFRFKGLEHAHPNPIIVDFMKDPGLTGIVICPSNPFVSVEPILALPEMRKLITTANVPVVAVTPIVGGKAIKGPTAKMMTELSIPVTAASIARRYQGLINGYILDSSDNNLVAEIEGMGIKVTLTATIMSSLDDKIQLASEVLKFINNLHRTR